jgi:Uma2 family endonuclease
MMDAQVQTELMTIEEFVRRYDKEGPFEVIGGVIRPLSPTVHIHDKTLNEVYWVFSKQIRAKNLGEIHAKTPFVLTYGSNYVKESRVPDLMFISAERIAAYEASDPDADSKPLLIEPDLVIEIISLDDKYSEVHEKVRRYTDDLVEFILLVDPQRRNVVIHSLRSQDATHLYENDSMMCGIPGFEVKVADIFKSIKARKKK